MLLAQPGPYGFARVKVPPHRRRATDATLWTDDYANVLSIVRWN
jgi:hypothetical protein